MSTPTIRLTIKPAPIIRGTVRGIGLPGPPGDDASATTDAGALVSGTLDDDRLSANVVLTSGLLAALNPVVAILLTNCDTITSNETTETLVLADDTSTDILGPGL